MLLELAAGAIELSGVSRPDPIEVGWWKTDDLWYWSLEALVAYLRVALERAGGSIDVICRRVAERYHVTLDD